MSGRVLALLLGVSACTSKMVTPVGSTDPDPNAPVNEAERPGIVSYLNEGIASVRAARRRNAYKKMHDACHGPYRIDTEGDRIDGGIVVTSGHVGGLFSSHRVYIQFSCVREGAAQEP